MVENAVKLVENALYSMDLQLVDPGCVQMEIDQRAAPSKQGVEDILDQLAEEDEVEELSDGRYYIANNYD